MRPSIPFVRVGMIVVVAVLTLAWYLPFPFSTLVGDDLYNYDHMRSGAMLSSPHQILFESWLDKYRPVFFVVFATEFRLFGGAIGRYIAFNTAVEVLNGWLFLSCALLMTRARWIISSCLTAVFVTSHFAVYQLWQTTGIVEGLATTLFLACLRCLLGVLGERPLRSAWGATLAWAACVFTHERYLVFAPVLAATLLVSPSVSVAVRQRLAMLSAIVTVGAFNVALKEWVLGSRFMTGTDGQSLTLMPGRILGFCLAAVRNVAGFNTGPAFLSGETFAAAGRWVHIAAWTALASAGLLAAGGVVHRRREMSRHAAPTMIIGALWFATAVVSASLAFRQEFRWLLAPEIVFLLGIAFVAGSASVGGIVAAAVPVFVTANLVLAWHYRQADRRSLFFLSGEALAESTKALISTRVDPPRSLQVLTSDPREVCEWVFGKGTWFTDYARIPATKVDCVGDIASLRADFPGSSQGALAIAAVRGGGARDITDLLGTFLAARASGAAGTDLAERASRIGIVAPDRAVLAPGGHGAFRGTWDTRIGPMASITVIDGFAMRLAVSVGTGEDLVVYPAAVLANGGDSDVSIELTDRTGRLHRLWQTRLSPRPEDFIAPGAPVRLPLDAYAGQDVTLAFIARPATGPGNWVMFGAPSLWRR